MTIHTEHEGSNWLLTMASMRHACRIASRRRAVIEAAIVDDPEQV